MINIQVFAFNPFQENTYVLFDETNECVIIDPGCHSQAEQETLSGFIKEKGLRPVRLLNTHCHIDHVMGNKYVASTYGLELEANVGDAFIVENQQLVSQTYEIPTEQSPAIAVEIKEGDRITFGNSELEAIHVPGHSPGSIVYYSEKDSFMVVGDVLFSGSIGRSDLPGGNHAELIEGIKTKLLTKAEDTVVYSGHGPSTTIGREKVDNPFLNGSY